MSLKEFETAELQDRYQQLTEKYINVLPELIKHLENFGKLRNELQLLHTELSNRNSLPVEEKDLERVRELLKQYDNANPAKPK